LQQETPFIGAVPLVPVSDPSLFCSGQNIVAVQETADQSPDEIIDGADDYSGLLGSDDYVPTFGEDSGGDIFTNDRGGAERMFHSFAHVLSAACSVLSHAAWYRASLCCTV
jgi:hypothetical protein